MEENIIKKPIGVFDSGVGGLTVLKSLRELCPNEDYVYFGDTKNLPYGEKTKEELLFITKKVFDFFEEKGVKAVIMACNTTAAQVYEELKDSYSYKLYPIIQIASECIAHDVGSERVAVLATNATINSHAYSKSLKLHNPKTETIEIACPEWVPIVENKLKDYNEEEIILKYLKPALEFNPQKIILGCTHYPYLLDKLAKYAPRELFINPAESFSGYLSLDLIKSCIEKTPEKGKTEFFVSDSPETFLKNASLFLKIEDLPNLVKL